MHIIGLEVYGGKGGDVCLDLCVGDRLVYGLRRESNRETGWFVGFG